MATKRLVKELNTFRKLNYIKSVELRDDNIFFWVVTFDGEKNTMYEEIEFTVTVSFPSNYPFEAPKILFVGQTYHPNIGGDGSICLGVMHPWSPSVVVRMLFENILELLRNPNVEDPLMPHIAKIYINDSVYFAQMVENTKKAIEYLQ